MSDDVMTLDKTIFEAVPADEKWYKVSMNVKRTRDGFSLLIDELEMKSCGNTNSSTTKGSG